MEYIIVVIAFIVIGLSVSFIFNNILHIKVFGGFVMMSLIATVGALLGSYYIPKVLSFLEYIKINFPASILGSIILVILLFICTPKSIK